MSLRNAHLALLAVPLAMTIAAACSPEEKKPGEPEKPAAAAQPAEEPANIPILEGYKYYVAGPVMKKDAYGRFRIADFQGEVAQPPSRGLIFGVKREGDKFEYKVWANGRLVGGHRGVIREGLYWPTYREGYRDQKLVAREHIVNDDEAKLMRIKAEDMDPQTGEVIRTTEVTQTYTPPALPADAADEEDGGDVAEPAGKAADAADGAAPTAPKAADPTPAAPTPPATPGAAASPPAAPAAPAAPSAPAGAGAH